MATTWESFVKDTFIQSLDIIIFIAPKEFVAKMTDKNIDVPLSDPIEFCTIQYLLKNMCDHHKDEMKNFIIENIDFSEQNGKQTYKLALAQTPFNQGLIEGLLEWQKKETKSND